MLQKTRRGLREAPMLQQEVMPINHEETTVENENMYSRKAFATAMKPAIIPHN
jgi:hypothetical protein